MTDAIWKKLWMLTLVAYNVEAAQARQAFDVLYGNQAIDLYKDPISDALMLVPQPFVDASEFEVFKDVTPNNAWHLAVRENTTSTV